jgi:hypothetical protein
MTERGTSDSLTAGHRHSKKQRAEPGEPVPPRGFRRPVLIAVCTVLALVGTGVFLTVRDASETRQLRSLPEASRHELYEHGMEELTTICRLPAATSGTLRAHCLEQAQLLRVMPECARDCRLAVGAVQPHPSR